MQQFPVLMPTHCLSVICFVLNIELKIHESNTQTGIANNSGPPTDSQVEIKSPTLLKKMKVKVARKY
jgi:hypothetical protein